MPVTAQKPFSFDKAQFPNSTKDWTFQEVGTLKTLAKGKKIKFSKKNLASDKRVTLLISKSGDFAKDAEILNCTEPLSVIIREKMTEGADQKTVLSALLDLKIQIDPKTKRYFLFQPAGNGDILPSYSVADLEKENTSWEDFAY